jgi:hypothetical protein
LFPEQLGDEIARRHRFRLSLRGVMTVVIQVALLSRGAKTYLSTI